MQKDCLSYIRDANGVLLARVARPCLHPISRRQTRA